MRINVCVSVLHRKRKYNESYTLNNNKVISALIIIFKKKLLNIGLSVITFLTRWEMAVTLSYLQYKFCNIFFFSLVTSLHKYLSKEPNEQNSYVSLFKYP